MLYFFLLSMKSELITKNKVKIQGDKVNTLDDVIKSCEKDYGLIVAKEERDMYYKFLQRQLRRHRDYNLNYQQTEWRHDTFVYFNLLAHKLLILAYLIRKKKVKRDYYDQYGTLLDNEEKLHLLRVRGSRTYEWGDTILSSLYMRIEYNKKKYGLMGYIEIINEIGKDPLVASIWKREISYEKDISARVKHNY